MNTDVQRTEDIKKGSIMESLNAQNKEKKLSFLLDAFLS